MLASIPAAAVANLEYRLLGSLDVSCGGDRVALGGHKQRSVLALLLLDANRVVSTDRLIDAVWREQPPGKPLTALQVLVSQLRKLLGHEALMTEPAGYRIVVERESVDVQRLGSVLEETQSLVTTDPARAASLAEKAIGLFRGPPLADFGYEDWAQAEIGRLEEVRLVLAELQIEAGLALGRHAELVGEIEALVAEHPLREHPRCLLMMALYRAGRQADALDAYQAARRALADELGIEPGPELQELNRRILRQDAGLVPFLRPALAQPRLPQAPARLIGRQTEIGEAGRLLADGDVRLVTLTGPGGTGKTRLALALATEAAPVFPDGTFWVGLSALRDPALVAPAVMGALAVKEGEMSQEETLRSALSGRRLLLVLDNAEQLLPRIANTVAGLLEVEGPVLLVTSRDRLNLRSEHVYPLPPLGTEDAVELFVDRTAQHGSAVDRTQEVEELCVRLDGLPLALELAAARTSVLSPAQILARLSQRLDLFQAGRDTDPRQATLRATIAWSYDLLSERERNAFARLSIFVGGFSLEAAETVGPTELAVVAALVDKSLLQNRDGRFSMLETIREYAQERLAADPEAGAVRLRHAQWLMELAEEADKHLRTREEAQWVAALSLEDANFRAALVDLETRGQWNLIARLAAALGRYWYIRAALVDAEWAVAALAHVPEPGRLRGKVLNAVTYLRGQQGRLDEAGQLARERIDLYRTLGDEAEEAEALSDLSIALVHSGDVERAKSALLTAATLARKTGTQWVLVLSLSNLADVSLQQGEYEDAIAVGEEAIAVAQELGEPGSIAIALVNAGTAASLLGRFDLARERLSEGARLAARAGYTMATVSALEGLAATVCATGDLAGAARLLGHAKSLMDGTGAAMPGVEPTIHERTIAALERQLSPEELREEMAAGASSALDELVISLAGAPASAAHRPDSRDTSAGIGRH